MTVRRVNRGGGHSYYDVTEDGVERRLDGVTTLIGNGVPKGGLVPWAAGQAAEHAVTHWDELTSLGLLERAKEIQYAWQRNRDAAAGKGTRIHVLAEKLLHGEEVETPEGLEGHVEACVKFLDRYGVEPVLSETVVVNRAVGYAGTLDLVGDMRRERWLLDWKTGKSVYPEAALQLAAYRHAEHYLGADGVEAPVADLGIERAAVVHLRADGFDVYPMETGPDVFNLFRHVVYVARWVRWDRTDGARWDAFKGAAL